VVAPRPSNKFNPEVAKLSLFDRDARKVVKFVIACKLCILEWE